MTKIHEIVDLINGYPFKKSDWSENSSGTKIIRIQNLNNEESFFNGFDSALSKYILHQSSIFDTTTFSSVFIV